MVGGGVCKVIFMSNPTVVLRLGWGFDNISFCAFQDNKDLLMSKIKNSFSGVNEKQIHQSFF